MHIGELARRSKRSVHTIRWYESQRLIPNVDRDTGRRRVYRETHVAWLALLERLKQTGMSIREMREYTALVATGESTIARRVRLLGAHRAKVEGLIVDLRASLDLIDAKIRFYDRWLATGRRPDSTGAARTTPRTRRRSESRGLMK